MFAAPAAKPAEMTHVLVSRGCHARARGGTRAHHLADARAHRGALAARRRSVLFLLVSGEEIGIRGSEYEAARPRWVESERRRLAVD